MNYICRYCLDYLTHRLPSVALKIHEDVETLLSFVRKKTVGLSPLSTPKYMLSRSITSDVRGPMLSPNKGHKTATPANNVNKNKENEKIKPNANVKKAPDIRRNIFQEPDGPKLICLTESNSVNNETDDYGFYEG